MIFSVKGHVEQIIAGTKTQTRRDSDRYKVGKSYAVQRCRTCKGILEGRIKIIRKYKEVLKRSGLFVFIKECNALAEGGYGIMEFEGLYEKIHPNWDTRYAYEFVFIKEVSD